MRYNFEEIATRVRVERKKLIIKLSVIASVMLVLLILALLNFKNSVTLYCSLLELPLVGCLIGVLKRSDAAVVFSREITGKNIKEHEYAVQNDRQPPIFRRVNVANTFANRKAYPARLKGTVYLELENGSITEISGLYKSHVDIYEEGDVLLKPEGAKFPVVTSREVSKKPCPLCGEINDGTRNFCNGCGLEILK